MGQLPGLTCFLHEVRSLVRSLYFRVRATRGIYSLKNHLEIIQVISTTLQTIRLTEANFREARGMFNPSEQSDIDYVVEGSKRALGNIQHSLAEPEMDLRILSQLHNYVVKFGLAIHLIDVRCNLAKTVSWVRTHKQSYTDRNKD